MTAPALARRPETEADAAFRFALFESARGAHERIAGLDPALAETLLRHQFAGQAASYRAAYPRARFDVVEADGVPVGRIVVDEGAEAWTLVDLALLPAWRGRGLGTRLIVDVMAGARAAGRPLRLSVMAANHGAQRLYARLGFTAAGAGDGVALAMEWHG